MVFDRKAYMKEWREKNKKSLKEQRATIVTGKHHITCKYII